MSNNSPQETSHYNYKSNQIWLPQRALATRKTASKTQQCTFFDACPTPIACEDILNCCLRYFKESNSRSPLQLHPILYMRTTINTIPMYKCTWSSIYPQADITLKNGHVYRIYYLQVNTTKNNEPNYILYPQFCITQNKGFLDYALNHHHDVIMETNGYPYANSD